MDIPSPGALKRANASKKFAAPEQQQSSTPIDPEEKARLEEEKIQQKTDELMAKCIKELEKYKGAAIVVGCKYFPKKAIINVQQAFVDSGEWTVKRSYDAPGQEVTLIFKGAE